jgi:hypothetical protein
MATLTHHTAQYDAIRTGGKLHLGLSAMRKLFLLNLMVATIASLGAQDHEDKYRTAQMIEAHEYDWCHYDCAPFDRPTLFFCFNVGGHILIGSRKADWAWMYDSHQMFSFAGKPVALRHNDRSIWVVRTDQKEMQLEQNYSEDVFGDPSCNAEIHRHWISGMADIKRPRSVPPEAVLVPKGPRPLFRSEGPHFWIACVFNLQANWDLCTMWDEKGVNYKTLECIDGETHRPVLDSDLTIDPLSTRTDYEIHLKNGTVLKDWARARINDVPTATSAPPLPPLLTPEKTH